MVAHTCNLSTQEQMEVQKVKVILNYTLSFKVILGYMKYCLSGERFKLHFSKVIFYTEESLTVITMKFLAVGYLRLHRSQLLPNFNLFLSQVCSLTSST